MAFLFYLHGSWIERSQTKLQKCSLSLFTIVEYEDTYKIAEPVLWNKIQLQKLVSPDKLALISFFISMSGYNVDNLSFDIEWLLKHVAVIVNDISHGKRANWQKDRPMVDFGSIFGRGSTMIRSTWSIFEINSSWQLWFRFNKSNCYSWAL